MAAVVVVRIRERSGKEVVLVERLPETADIYYQQHRCHRRQQRLWVRQQ